MISGIKNSFTMIKIVEYLLHESENVIECLGCIKWMECLKVGENSNLIWEDLKIRVILDKQYFILFNMIIPSQVIKLLRNKSTQMGYWLKIIL